MLTTDFAALRKREFARLDARGVAYLDYAATALYGESQLLAHHAFLRDGVFGNPHSESGPSRASARAIEEARAKVLAFFDVGERTHEVVFTAGATSAIKLVAESWPFSTSTTLALSADNHNSVNGMREYARRAGARLVVLPLDAELRMDDPDARLAACAGPGLFAFPAQSNFSGVRHPLALVDRAKARGLDVLLDVAALAPTHALSLRDHPADFAVLSFHKLFGHPTGTGALVARKESLARLRRPWFAGGTVHYASIARDVHRLHEGHAGFEDGTPDFLALAALLPGFRLLDDAGMAAIAAHVARLGRALLECIAGLPHVRVHGPRGAATRGATIALDVLDAEGHVVPHADVEARAREVGIAIRGGCFCNPGAAEAALGVERAPRGAVRMSLGLANDDADVGRAVALLASFAA